MICEVCHGARGYWVDRDTGERLIRAPVTPYPKEWENCPECGKPCTCDATPPAGSDLGERAHHIAFGFPALSPEERADLTAEISALCAAIRAEAESAGYDLAVKALRARAETQLLLKIPSLDAAIWLASVKPQREG